MAVLPATGMNCQAYVPAPSVSRSTPFVPVIRTSLFASGVPNGYGPEPPPVPTTNSRIPFTGSAPPVGVWSAKRS